MNSYKIKLLRLLKTPKGAEIMREIKTINPQEQILWIGKTSHTAYALWYIICFATSFLILPLFFALALYIILENKVYVLTSERVRVYSGVFLKKIRDVDLFRVIDTVYNQSLWMQFMGIANITAYTTDEVYPIITFEGIAESILVREELRKHALLGRNRNNVQSIDYFSLLPPMKPFASA